MYLPLPMITTEPAITKIRPKVSPPVMTPIRVGEVVGVYPSVGERREPRGPIGCLKVVIVVGRLCRSSLGLALGWRKENRKRKPREEGSQPFVPVAPRRDVYPLWLEERVV